MLCDPLIAYAIGAQNSWVAAHIHIQNPQISRGYLWISVSMHIHINSCTSCKLVSAEYC